MYLGIRSFCHLHAVQSTCSVDTIYYAQPSAQPWAVDRLMGPCNINKLFPCKDTSFVLHVAGSGGPDPFA